MKKTVLYIIDSLGLGGAEMLVVSQLPEVRKRYNVVLVTLSAVNQFDQEIFCDACYCLHMNGKKDLFSAVKKLKAIMRAHNVTLINSVLYWSVIVARLAAGRKVHHVSNLAITMSDGSYNLKWYSGLAKLLDKITYRKTETIIGASKEVLNDFDKAVGFKGRYKLLYNFVNDVYFNIPFTYKKPVKGLRLVAVGNLREQKNYQYLIDAFSMLKDQDVSIDIYGQGHLKGILQEQINDSCLSINLKGAHQNISEVLPLYDGYVMCSEYEGFGIAAAEAMAVGLPVLLSDIPVLREVSQNNALFFNPRKPGELVDHIKSILSSKIDLDELSSRGKEVAASYTRDAYIKGLFQLMDEIFDAEPAKVIHLKPVFN